ncbi:MAG: hypothetical protein QOC59_656 [Microbacteriaceae bacterium]|jgi:hypothetical protein|nr:hypothetical protein [Microbacteriaceae bacterium]
MHPITGAVVHFAQPLHASQFVLQDYVPVAVVSLVLLAFAVALVVVSVHHHRDAD